ncbi:AAA family ATPase [Helicobacter bizzozeronii]|uniref:AAA family ATPase n=1 Tax=Helicobacter bizzozeronii TaxID=56877 RepID=UPI000CF04388|nr:AAA family ATPase [Helicobacter bizzozeronii]
MIITIANEKGGSGKSTLCINLALQFLKAQKDVVVLDTDPQQSVEVFINIRGETNLATFPLFNRTGNITDTLKQMVGKYDTIIIDTKGEHSKESQRAILLSDIVLIPTTPSQLDTAVLLEMFERIENLQSLNEKLKALILINRMPPIPILKEKQALVSFIEQYNTNHQVSLLKNHLCERIAFKRSIAEGLGVMEYSDAKAKTEWQEFFKELKTHLSTPN